MLAPRCPNHNHNRKNDPAVLFQPGRFCSALGLAQFSRASCPCRTRPWRCAVRRRSSCASGTTAAAMLRPTSDKRAEASPGTRESCGRPQKGQHGPPCAAATLGDCPARPVHGRSRKLGCNVCLRTKDLRRYARDRWHQRKCQFTQSQNMPQNKSLILTCFATFETFYRWHGQAWSLPIGNTDHFRVGSAWRYCINYA